MQRIRIRQATLPLTINDDLLLQIHDSLMIGELQKLVSDQLNLSASRVKLYFGGKQLTSAHTISDYKIHDNDVVQFLLQNDSDENNMNCKYIETNIVTNSNIVSATSDFYTVGDRIDVIYNDLGAWFESKINGIFADHSKTNQNEEELIFQVVMDRNEQTAPINVTFKDIRPRAKYFYDLSELQPGMVVFVNYNMENPKETGYWYDFKITNIEKTKLQGILILPQSNNTVYSCSVTYSFDKVMKIEQPTILTEKKIANETIPLRKLALYCKKCKDVSSKNCDECGCNFCGQKNFVDKMIICDECECTYHLFCLVPRLSEIPAEPEWYCPDCKTDENEIVKPGENLKIIENNKRRKKCMQAPNSFGTNLGVEVGTSWGTRSEVFDAGVHLSLKSNIHANEEGGFSMILESQDEVSSDNGYEFYYTFFGRRQGSNMGTISTNISFRESTKMAKQLAVNCNNAKLKNCAFGKTRDWKYGKPINVIRSQSLKSISKYAPHSGYRYDGIYKVFEYFPELDTSEFILWRFLIRRDDPSLPPWSTTTKARNLKIMATYLESPSKKLKSMDFDEKVKEIINLDTRNKALWDECNSVWQQGKEEFIKKVQELFRCVCCHEVLYLPVTTKCNHNICYECLRRCFRSKLYRCPSCRLLMDRNILRDININLNTALKLMFPGYG